MPCWKVLTSSNLNLEFFWDARRKKSLSTDIEKMFNQVSVLENDRSALRYLWRPIGKSKPPYTYEMQVQVFVAVSSPTICNFVLQRAAKDCAAEFPFATTRVEEKYYVDNYHYLTLTIAKKTPERLSKTSSFFWTEEGSNWRNSNNTSTSRYVLNKVPAERHALPNLDLEWDILPTEKTLGLLWNATKDVFLIKSNVSFHEPTRRWLLSTINRIDDPLGYVQPVTQKAKRIPQKSNQIDDLQWYVPLPPKLMAR